MGVSVIKKLWGAVAVGELQEILWTAEVEEDKREVLHSEAHLYGASSFRMTSRKLRQLVFAIEEVISPALVPART